jgi:hypothetical protein
MMRRELEYDADLTGPVDEDLLLTGDCILGHASAEHEAEFERRYVEDEAFYHKVAPLVAALIAPVNYTQLIAEADAGVHEPQAQSRYSANPSFARKRFGGFNEYLYAGVWVMAAASLLIIGTWVYASFALTEPTPPATVIAVRPVQKSQPPAAPTPPPAAAPVPFPSAAAVEQPIRRRSGVYLQFLDLSGDSVRADSTADKVVETEDGARVLVRRGSAFRHTAMPGSSRMRALEVKGELAIEVGGETLMYQVVSRAGVVWLMSGSYALRCVASCAALEVSVGSGMAILYSDRAGSPGVQLLAGQYGRAFRDSASVVVPPDAAGNFPALDSAFTARAKEARALRKTP